MDNNTEEKEIIEITNETDVISEEEINESKTKKNKKKFSFKNLSKKQKIFVLIGITLLLIIGLVLIIYFVLLNSEEKIKTEEKDSVIIEMNNYRYEDGTLIFLDSSDNEIGRYECTLKDEEKCMISSYTQEDSLTNIKYVDESNELLMFDMPIFNDRFVFVYDDEKNILFDIENNEEIDTYNIIKRYKDNNVIVQNSDGKYGVLNFGVEEIETVIEFNYDLLSYLNETSILSFSRDGKYGLIDIDGKEIVSNVSKEIISYNDLNLIASGSNNNFSLLDKNNTNLLDESYDYIKITNEYIFLIENNQLLIRDLNLNKINEEGIELTDITDYNSYVVYDDNLSKKDEISSFEYDLNENNILTIKTGDINNTYNLYETKINEKYEYLNYINGIIYIYSDSEKEDLEGKYTCENKNIVNESSTSFDNCFIAKETNLTGEDNPSGFIPIYSNKYIFIMDKKSGVSSNNIYLVDYTQTSSDDYPTYTKVDVNYNSNDDKVVHRDASNLEIMAENTKGNLGIIIMNNETVSSYIRFLYKSIEEYNDSYIVKEEDGSYHIIDNSGRVLTDESSSITNEIISYSTNYIKTKDSSGKFVLYSFSGKVLSKQLDYVDAKDNIFLGVINNKIEVYRYTDGTTNMLDIEINKEGSVIELVDNSTNGFIITLKDDNDKILKTYSFDQNGNSKS